MSALADRGRLLALLRDVAEAAGKVILEIYATDFAVRDKGVGDPVTLADERANALIVDALLAAYPGIPIVAEESDHARYAGFEGADAVFFVDPLDGTREFVAKNGEFVVMIGLAERGRAVAGAIHAPATGVTLCGALGHGATRTDARGTTPIRASNAPPASARAVVSRSRRGAILDATLARAGIGDVVQLGSAGLKAAAVATGERDLYAQLGRAGSLWDACAPEAIVRAAGGAFTDQRGAAIDYRGPLVLASGLVAGSPLACAAFLGAVDPRLSVVR